MKTKSEKLLFIGKDGQNYLFPFILITSLFFLWGFAHSLLDVLNKHFQDSLHLSKAQSGAVQASAYGAYFLMAIPAGLIARKFGYKSGVVVGLALFALGAFWFVPAVEINTFWAFLLGLLILFCGLTCLETVANPYTIVLGSPETSASRINLAQTFNAIGWILGPLVGSVLIFKNESDRSTIELFVDAIKKVFLGANDAVANIVESVGDHTSNSVLMFPYVGLGCVVVLVLVFFLFAKLPEIKSDNHKDTSILNNNTVTRDLPLIKQRHFVLAVVAQFLYVAAQTGIGSFFINYAIEVKELQLTEIQAGLLLGLGGMSLFAVGRFSGSMIMQKMKPGSLLGLCAAINTLLMFFVIMNHNRFGIIALISCYLFMSIMFPSIFALGLRDLGDKTKTASSILVLTVVGGAIAPSLMGILGVESMNVGFIIPLICFLYISFFGYVGSRIKA
ncbi:MULTISPECIES: L-fucose:H+ symporter permease [Dysgonomonas]|uniref:L-fucose:H+ symporter permease n=1 Tax=Dysgonomonas TaxID=156973 RepID=UPI0009261A1E|nr:MULTISPECIES: L-fucose:H+ symporter permease [Dysgonomonas]MBN9303063.1 L-fucose:H+ symporter permease [Dysgonomonas mossii]OJX61017.1 MAG: L-fucose:H+ symporter permease [Dysgonomonas sp. 37-18]